MVGVAPSCGFSDHWGCLGRLGNMLALLWVVLTPVAHMSLHIGGLGDTLGLFRLILAVWGTLWGTFGHLAAILGLIWELLVSFWVSFGTSSGANLCTT